MGTLLLARFNDVFVEDDLILAEEDGRCRYGILREETDRLEQEARHVVKLAVRFPIQKWKCSTDV